MKEIIKTIPISTFLLTYLFVCGVLYLIGYWGTFNIDAFSLISIYDIPKNFVFPLLISQGFFVITFVTGGVTNFNDDREDIRHFITINPAWEYWKKFVFGILSLINLWLIVIVGILYYYIKNPYTDSTFWSLSSILVAYYLLHRFVNLKTLKDNVKSKLLRSYIGHFIVFLPISCFSTGKVTSLKIYHNKENKYVKIISTSKTSMIADTTITKFLGFISDQVIVSSLDNKKTYIFNKTSIDGIELIKQ